MIDAVVFEFDGVIADTRVARRSALLDTLDQDGVRLDETEYEERCAAMPVRASVRAAFALRKLTRDETTVELTAVRAERRFNELIGPGLSLTDGARAFIESLQGQTRLAIVSWALRSEITSALEMAQLDHAFEFIIADDDALQSKPSPAAYLAALDRLGRRRRVTTKNVVAFEAGSAGIRAAKAAGVRCAVVGPLPVHLAVNADAIVPSFVGQTLASIDALTLGTHAAER
jgi:HAD superfamily hydrolase (TIGR01509 family)